MIIVFSGTDGAGKSTQIEMLMSYLESNGKRSKSIWTRGGYTPGFTFLKKIMRRFLRSKLPEAGESKERGEMLKNKNVSTLWLVLAILDLLYIYAVYMRVLSLLGYVVIADRYIDDTKIDFQRNFGEQFKQDSIMWRLLMLLSAKPTKAFVLYVPVGVSQYRSKLKNEPFPDSEETLSYRLAQYLNDEMFPASRYVKIDCSGEIQIIFSKIQRELGFA